MRCFVKPFHHITAWNTRKKSISYGRHALSFIPPLSWYGCLCVFKNFLCATIWTIPSVAKNFSHQSVINIMLSLLVSSIHKQSEDNTRPYSPLSPALSSLRINISTLFLNFLEADFSGLIIFLFYFKILTPWNTHIHKHSKPNLLHSSVNNNWKKNLKIAWTQYFG
jgi:hypothetical protein